MGNYGICKCVTRMSDAHVGAVFLHINATIQMERVKLWCLYIKLMTIYVDILCWLCKFKKKFWQFKLICKSWWAFIMNPKKYSISCNCSQQRTSIAARLIGIQSLCHIGKQIWSQHIQSSDKWEHGINTC